MESELQLTVAWSGEQVSGTVTDGERRIAFSGWLELAAAIRALTDR